jgi:uncharacterized integral membrane protein
METSDATPMDAPNRDDAQDGARPGDAAVQVDAPPQESPRARVVRKGRRVRLYATAIVFVALLVILVALAAVNDRSVKLDWVAGSTHASLVWVILVATLVGWLLGMIMSALFRFRTRERH